MLTASTSSNNGVPESLSEPPILYTDAIFGCGIPHLWTYKYPVILRLSTASWIERHQPYSRSKKSYSPFGHAQYGLRLHVRYRCISLQVGYNVQLPEGW